jgi:hypothetical protein
MLVIRGGDKLRPTKKLNPLWFGPYLVIQRPSPNNFTLALPPDIKIHNTFHVSKLKPYHEGDFKNFQKARQLPNEFAKDPDYEISRIVDYKYQFGQQFYLVAFKGYSEVNDTMWFRRDILMKDAKKLVLRYETKNKIDTTTFCTPQYAYPGSVKVKKGRKKKK